MRGIAVNNRKSRKEKKGMEMDKKRRRKSTEMTKMLFMPCYWVPFALSPTHSLEGSSPFHFTGCFLQRSTPARVHSASSIFHIQMNRAELLLPLLEPSRKNYLREFVVFLSATQERRKNVSI